MSTQAPTRSWQRWNFPKSLDWSAGGRSQRPPRTHSCWASGSNRRWSITSCPLTHILSSCIISCLPASCPPAPFSSVAGVQRPMPAHARARTHLVSAYTHKNTHLSKPNAPQSVRVHKEISCTRAYTKAHPRTSRNPIRTKNTRAHTHKHKQFQHRRLHVPTHKSPCMHAHTHTRSLCVLLIAPNWPFVPEHR